jgi:hypothetical protein
MSERANWEIPKYRTTRALDPSALERREAACQAREEALAREEKRLAAIRTDLEAKHGRIKNLAGTLEG